MSIHRCDDLLCCSTLRDWALLREERPELFATKEETNPTYRNLTLYFFLRGVAPIHVCTVLYQGRYYLLNGRKELMTILNFIYDNTPISRAEWRYTGGLPGSKGEVSLEDFPKETKYRILNVVIPQSSFIIDSKAELDLLKQYYTPFASAAIC